MSISTTGGSRYRVSIAVLASMLALAETAFAQTAAPVSLNYSLKVPIAKVIPNTCTGGFVLIKGAVTLSVTTTAGGSVPFRVGVLYTSSGSGQDALSNGTLIVDGSQKANYAYSSQTATDAGFASTPQDFMQDAPVRDFLVRTTGDKSDELQVDTAIDLTFTNGVPSAAVLQGLSVACSAVQ